jgi:hypothetical protein
MAFAVIALGKRQAPSTALAVRIPWMEPRVMAVAARSTPCFFRWFFAVAAGVEEAVCALLEARPLGDEERLCASAPHRRAEPRPGRNSGRARCSGEGPANASLVNRAKGVRARPDMSLIKSPAAVRPPRPLASAILVPLCLHDLPWLLSGDCSLWIVKAVGLTSLLNWRSFMP